VSKASDSGSKSSLSVGDYFAISQVFQVISRDNIEAALCASDRSNRRDGNFPDYLVVYYVIFMALFMELSYAHVLKKIGEVLEKLDGFDRKVATVSASAITQARQRIGKAPLKALFDLVAKPLASDETPGAFFHSLRLASVDGTIFDAEDSEKNSKEFGSQINDKGAGAYPQVRCVALIENASRATIDVEYGPYVGSSEQSLTKLILARLKPGTLVLGDRLQPGYENCSLVVKAGAHFAFRAKKDFKLTPEDGFEDGSYLAKLYSYDKKTRKRLKDSLLVRVVEYKVKGSNEKYRLITSILEPEKAPAGELAKLYPKRWTQETINNEIKTDLRKPRIVLRSKSPDTVIQELYALFLAHYVVRFFMFQAARHAQIPPESLSFKHSVFVLKDNLPKIGSFSP